MSNPAEDRATPAPQAVVDAALARVEVAGQQCTVYEESAPLIAAMVDDIRAARARVWMETYIFADDEAGQAVAAALREQAAAGRDVRLMVDGWGSFSMPRAMINRLRAAGVQVHLYHALGASNWGWKFLRVLNRRNHRKLLIVDDHVAYFGGMNVVDQSGIHSRADARRKHLPASAGWRDVHVRLEGSRQAEIAATMEWLWNREHRRRPGKALPWPVKALTSGPDESILFFASRPRSKNRRPQLALVPLLEQAQREITVAVAYFIPTGRVLRALLQARRRGVRVRVIIPGQSDVKIVQWACRHFYEYLLKRGIRIYERHDRMLHAKALVIDDRWAVVGSCNLDSRSLRLNLEFFAAVRAPQFADAIRRICREEMCNSTRVDAEHCRSRGWLQRCLDRTAWQLRKWL